MSFTRTSSTKPRRSSLTSPSFPSPRTLQQHPEHLKISDQASGADIHDARSTDTSHPSHQTQLPSPLITFAPNSPPLSPIDLTPVIQPNQTVPPYRDLEAGRPALYGNEDEDLEACMPPGWPYRDWRDYAWLALEWIQNMQGLLMNLMEQEHRLGGARHTI